MEQDNHTPAPHTPCGAVFSHSKTKKNAKNKT
jgi:hypothetical protein